MKRRQFLIALPAAVGVTVLLPQVIADQVQSEGVAVCGTKVLGPIGPLQPEIFPYGKFRDAITTMFKKFEFKPMDDRSMLDIHAATKDIIIEYFPAHESDFEVMPMPNTVVLNFDPEVKDNRHIFSEFEKAMNS